MGEEELKRKREDLWHFRRYAGPVHVINPATWPNSWLGAAYGFSSVAIGSYFYGRWYKRPWFSALPYKISLCTAMGMFGYFGGWFRDFHMSTRDAVLEHYMQLHPEDFAHLSGKGGRKLKDLFLPWNPVRVQERLPRQPDV